MPFDELSLNEFHDIISLRMEVFGVEQQAIYNDLDGYDKKSWHLLVKDNDEIIGTARILPPKLKYNEASFGRVVLKPAFRNKGIAHKMVINIIDFINEATPNEEIKISAMYYLKEFYERYGFKGCSAIYLDCDIQHIDMIKTL